MVMVLYAIGGTSAQRLEVVDDAGLVSVEWDTQPGVAYRLQGSGVLHSWSNVDGDSWLYGLGQRISYAVHSYDPGGGAGAPPIGDPPSSTHWFVITEHSARNKLLVSWGGDHAGQSLLARSDLPASLPPVLSVEVDDGAGGHYALSFFLAGGAWQDAFLTDPSLDQNNLDTDQLLELGKLTGAYSEIQNAINTGATAAQGSSVPSGGASSHYRLETSQPDSDGDGVPDATELGAHGTDPFHPDSDRDGILDGDEIAFGSDPNDPTSTPSGVDTSARIQTAVITITGDASSLTVSARLAGRQWEVVSMTGPGTQEMEVTRGVEYLFQLSLPGSGAATVDVAPKAPETEWKWHAEFGDGDLAVGGGGTSSPVGTDAPEKRLLPANIVPDDGEPGVTGDQIPSINGDEGEKHYVSPKKSAEIPNPHVVLIAENLTEEDFDANLEWEWEPMANASVDPENSTRIWVKRDAPGKTVVRLKKQEDDEVVDTMNVWVVWCEITAHPGTSEYLYLTQGGEYIASRAGIAKLPASVDDPEKYWRFSFRILPPSIITAEEKPDLEGERESPVPSEGNEDGEGEVYHVIYINAFAGSAQNKWDVSRAMQVTLDNPNLITKATLESGGEGYGNVFINQDPPKATDMVVAFPTDPVMGNDDVANLGDEDTNPYDPSNHPVLEHPVGEITSMDAPKLDFHKLWGTSGREFGQRAKFREFARVELWDEERKGATWFRISDYHGWYFTPKSVFDDPPAKWNDDGTSTGNE
jgi:hypothetical protein